MEKKVKTKVKRESGGGKRGGGRGVKDKVRTRGRAKVRTKSGQGQDRTGQDRIGTGSGQIKGQSRGKGEWGEGGENPATVRKRNDNTNLAIVDISDTISAWLCNTNHEVYSSKPKSQDHATNTESLKSGDSVEDIISIAGFCGRPGIV